MQKTKNNYKWFEDVPSAPIPGEPLLWYGTFDTAFVSVVELDDKTKHGIKYDVINSQNNPPEHTEFANYPDAARFAHELIASLDFN